MERPPQSRKSGSSLDAFGFRARCVRGSIALLCSLFFFGAPALRAQELIRGNYYWFAPEHETFSKTQFYSQPRFDTAQVRIPRTQRFRIVSGSKGWFMLEFDVAGKAYIHTRLLRNLVYDPAATDPWYEFKRASVFAEEPAKIEARLKAAAAATPDPQPADSKAPSWKRYKDSWNLRGSRASSASAPDPSDPNSTAARPYSPDRKARTKYPLLPPIGSEPEPERQQDLSEGSDGERRPAAGSAP